MPSLTGFPFFIPAILGVVLLLFGRKLFWLFVGAVGFIAGMALASWFLREQSQAVQLVVALLIGGVGAALAVVLQKVVVSVVGFVAGAYVLVTLIERFQWGIVYSPWLPIVIGGICGAIVLTIVFEWALLILSSLLGAILIVQTFDLSNEMNVAIFFVLSAIGIVVQARSKQKKVGPKT